MNTRELKPLMLWFGWQNAQEVGQYLKAMGWKIVRKDLYLLNCNDWKVGIDLEKYPVAHITVHNPNDHAEGHCTFDFKQMGHEAAFASEIEVWGKCAAPEREEWIN